MSKNRTPIGITHNSFGVPKRNVVIRQFYIDDKGEDLLIIKSTDKTKAIYLKLLSENKKRLLGIITRSTRTIHFKRKRSIHLFRKSNSYGFNQFLLSNQTTIDWVNLDDDEGGHWKIPVKYILEHGEYLRFSKVGFELQRFVSLENLEQFKIHDYENRRI